MTYRETLQAVDKLKALKIVGTDGGRRTKQDRIPRDQLLLNGKCWRMK